MEIVNRRLHWQSYDSDFLVAKAQVPWGQFIIAPVIDWTVKFNDGSFFKTNKLQVEVVGTYGTWRYTLAPQFEEMGEALDFAEALAPLFDEFMNKVEDLVAGVRPATTAEVAEVQAAITRKFTS